MCGGRKMAMGKKTPALCLAGISAIILMASDCATLTSRPNQRIPVTSHPPGARIIVDGEDMGHAPLTLRLRKKASHTLRIEQDGFNPVEISIGSGKSGIGAVAVLGDVLLALATGLAADYLEWLAAGRPDEEFGHLRASFFGGLIGASVGLVLLEGKSHARYSLAPHEISVTLRKAEGTPRVEAALINADDLWNIKWIRIHRD
jgi:hypothetical protein